MVRVLTLKVPKLRTCLGCIDLQTATEVITIFTLINKVSGFYGILSVFTGAQISALQMSMYVWSIFGTIVCLWALKQIKDETPMKVVAFAYFFVVDFVVNILYTVLFASVWFLLVSNPGTNSSPADNTFQSAKDSAGFVDPVHTDVAKAHMVGGPNSNRLIGEYATLIGQTGIAVDDGSASSTTSTIFIVLFSIIKLYLIVIVFSYARHLVLRSHLTAASFTLNSGFKEKLQRWMLSSGYWKEEEEDYKGSSRRL